MKTKSRYDSQRRGYAQTGVEAEVRSIEDHILTCARENGFPIINPPVHLGKRYVATVLYQLGREIKAARFEFYPDGTDVPENYRWDDDEREMPVDPYAYAFGRGDGRMTATSSATAIFNCALMLNDIAAAGNFRRSEHAGH